MLVAIAIPVFNAQLEKSKLATDTANVRAAYAETVAAALADGNSVSIDSTMIAAGDINTGTTVTFASGSITVARGDNSNVISVDSDVTVTAGTVSGSKQ